jgi:hypothetical protein
MSLTLNVGIARKVGLPDYSSVGASCSLELELDSAMLDRDPEQFQARVRAAYAAAERAVHDQLIRSRSEPGAEPEPMLRAPRILVIEADVRPPRGRSDLPRPTRPATAGQMIAIAAIVRRKHVDLDAILSRDYGSARPEELSLHQASSLIDSLKAMNGG